MNENYPEVFELIEKSDYSNPNDLKNLFVLLATFVSGVSDFTQNISKSIAETLEYLSKNPPINNKNLVDTLNEHADEIEANKKAIEQLKLKFKL